MAEWPSSGRRPACADLPRKCASIRYSVGDEVTIYGRIVSTGRSSMRVFVEAWRRNRESDDITKVTHATFTFVAIDKDRKPRPLPPADDAPATT